MNKINMTSERYYWLQQVFYSGEYSQQQSLKSVRPFRQAVISDHPKLCFLNFVLLLMSKNNFIEFILIKPILTNKVSRHR